MEIPIQPKIVVSNDNKVPLFRIDRFKKGDILCVTDLKDGDSISRERAEYFLKNKCLTMKNGSIHHNTVIQLTGNYPGEIVHVDSLCFLVQILEIKATVMTL